MTYGITGNPTKDEIWSAVSGLVHWLQSKGIPFCLQKTLADGLVERGRLDAAVSAEHAATDLAARSDVILSFGGDGTLLRTAHQSNGHGTPILGVNMGRLGFLTIAEVREMEAVVADMEAGRFGVEERMTLAVRVDGADVGDVPAWALNDVVVDKSGTTSIIQIETALDGAFLNTYWSDGLIVATPTGSTAYALSVGGPILSPGTDVVVVAPIAPHTLTARPIVLPCDAELTLRVTTRGQPYAFAVDGVSTLFEPSGVTIRVRRSEHRVRLVTLPDRGYFGTIRSKLSWGQGGVF